MDFLSKQRKMSSQAFPLMGSGDVALTKEDVYDFENRLRIVVEEILAPF